MANPGVFVPYASEVTWPFLALVGALVTVPLLGFAILMVIAGQTSRIRAVAAAVLALALATVSLWGLFGADADFRQAETANRAAYLGQVSEWLEHDYGVKLTETELSALLRSGGVSGQFDGATAFIVVRGDRDTGRLVVADRSGTEIPPTQP